MPDELKQLIHEFIRKMERDLAREQEIQEKANFEMLESESFKFPVCLN